MTTKETAYQIVSDIVQRFDEQKESYKKSDYNEAQTRQDFINPFFKAVRWNIYNSQGNTEAKKPSVGIENEVLSACKIRHYAEEEIKIVQNK